MPQHLVERMTLGLIVDRRQLTGPWAGERWTVAGVLAGSPALEPWATLAEAPGWRRYYAGTATLELFAGDTAGYRDNLASSRPALYAVLRRQRRAPGISIHALTVDPGEIEVHADAGDDLIEAVPLPGFLAAWIDGFVARHHVERLVYRRQRDRPDLEALGRRARAQGAPG